MDLKMKEVKENITSKVVELVADNTDMRNAFFENEKALLDGLEKIKDVK